VDRIRQGNAVEPLGSDINVLDSGAGVTPNLLWGDDGTIWAGSTGSTATINIDKTERQERLS